MKNKYHHTPLKISRKKKLVKRKVEQTGPGDHKMRLR